MPDLPTWVWITMFSIVDSIVWSIIMRRAVAKRDAEIREAAAVRIESAMKATDDLFKFNMLIHDLRSGKGLS